MYFNIKNYLKNIHNNTIKNTLPLHTLIRELPPDLPISRQPTDHAHRPPSLSSAAHRPDLSASIPASRPAPLENQPRLFSSPSRVPFISFDQNRSHLPSLCHFPSSATILSLTDPQPQPRATSPSPSFPGQIFHLPPPLRPQLFPPEPAANSPSHRPARHRLSPQICHLRKERRTNQKEENRSKKK